MDKLIAVAKTHAKAISAFVSAEAAAAITVLSTVEPSWKTWGIALLGPFVVGTAVSKTTNKPQGAF